MKLKSILINTLVATTCLLVTASAGADIRSLTYGPYYLQPPDPFNYSVLKLNYENVQKFNRSGVVIEKEYKGLWNLSIQGYVGAKKGDKSGKSTKGGRRVDFKGKMVGMPQLGIHPIRIKFKVRNYRKARAIIKKRGKLNATIAIWVKPFIQNVSDNYYNVIHLTLIK